VPQLPDSEALTVAVGIFGATVMPHAIYLYSAFVNSRLTAITAIVGAETILVPNIILLLQTFGVAIPGLPNAG
jgi:Mn2+/Fe2+ NRAMP family transporter